MGKKLFVGNLSFEVDDESLKTLFSQAGNVETARVIVDKYSGRSKGFGFVEMTSDQEASASIEKLNGTDFQGRAITVSEARPMKPRGEGMGGGGGFKKSFGGGRRSFGGGREGGSGGGGFSRGKRY